jgi:hypothetical protein
MERMGYIADLLRDHPGQYNRMTQAERQRWGRYQVALHKILRAVADLNRVSGTKHILTEDTVSNIANGPCAAGRKAKKRDMPHKRRLRP